MGTTRRSTSCAASSRPAARRSSTSATTARSQEIVHAAIQEDVQAIAISSYQGGHVEYFKYMIDLLRERGAQHIKVFGGGGGVIVPAGDPPDLEAYGVTEDLQP
jgi:methylmalonyl-CoA mutase